MNNERLHGTFYEDNTGDADITAKMFQWARERDPSVAYYVNDYNVALWEADE